MAVPCFVLVWMITDAAQLPTTTTLRAGTAIVYLGVESRAKTVSEAREAAAKAMTDVRAALKALGIADKDARDLHDLFRQGYQGSRYSFGYPACPRLEDQVPLLRLLGADRIGVSISDEWQLHPEQSTSAIVLHHPRAKYFSV